MRIYAVADIHGQADRLELIRRHIAAEKPHLLVLAGDITHFTAPLRTLERIDAFGIPTLCIRGNTDFKRVASMARRLQHLTCLHRARHVIHAIPFTGIGGTVPLPFHSKICFNESSMLNRLTPLVGRDTVLVVHPPPRGILDTVLGRFHVGSAGLRRLIQNRKPRLVICGHVHEHAGVHALGETVVVNCSMGRNNAGALIDARPGKELKIRMI